MDTALRDAKRCEKRALQLPQPVAALYAKQYTYATLAGQPITMTHRRSPEKFRYATEAEALVLGEDLYKRWRLQLAALTNELR